MARPKNESAADKETPKAEAASVRVNKSKVVRDYLAANPTATPKEVSAAMKDQGIDVTPNYVSIVKYQTKSLKGKGKKRGTASESSAAVKKATISKASDTFSLEILLQAKKLSESLGGIDAARQALSALSRLMG